jgi:hypothetical protein
MTHSELVEQWRSKQIAVSVNRGFALQHLATTNDRRRYDVFMFIGRVFLWAALPLGVGLWLLRIANSRTATTLGVLAFAFSYIFLGYANTQIARPACARALDRIMEDEKLFQEATARNALKVEGLTRV